MNQSPTTNPSPPTTPHLAAIACPGGAPPIDYGALGTLFRALLGRRRAGQRSTGAPLSRTRIVIALVLLVAGVLVPATAARAAAMTVPSGLVHISANGQCSLREAIDNANDDDQTHADCPAGSGADVITLGAGTYELSSGRVVEDDSAFAITSDITIIGAGSVSRDGGGATLLDAVEAFRHFEVVPGASLELEGMHLANGVAHEDAPSRMGGAVLNHGTFAATDVRFSHNTAADGGAVGGAGTAKLNETVFSQNTATERGGALFTSGVATVTDSNFSQNEAAVGAAVAAWDDSSLSIIGSVIRHNTVVGEWTETGFFPTAPRTGAAVETDEGTVTWIDSTTVGPNSGTGLANLAGIATITNSTIRGNRGDQVGGVANVAFYSCESFSIECGEGSFREASMTIRNSTISGNTASARAGVGGISSSDNHDNANPNDRFGFIAAEITLTNVTIADNVSAGAQVRGVGVIAHNVVVADPVDGPNCDETDDEDLVSLEPVPWAGGHNVSDDFSCSTGGFADIPDALLGPLTSNGGPTATHLPHPASLLVDAGDQAPCDSGVRPGTTATDQRGSGFLRTVGSSCDIGAVEVGVLGALGIMSDDVTTLPLRSGPDARNDGLRTSLLAKITEAAEAVDRGDYDAATGQLGAFNQQVEAYAGGPIMEADATRLTTGALVITDLFPEGGTPPDDG